MNEANPWRDSARSVRFGFLDARAMSGFFVWMMHMCEETFWFSVALVVLFVFLERFGVTVPVALRLARTSFFGPLRHHESGYALRRTRFARMPEGFGENQTGR